MSESTRTKAVDIGSEAEKEDMDISFRTERDQIGEVLDLLWVVNTVTLFLKIKKLHINMLSVELLLLEFVSATPPLVNVILQLT